MRLEAAKSIAIFGGTNWEGQAKQLRAGAHIVIATPGRLKDYHDKNIEFVSISIDQAKDHEKWVAMVNDKELGGVQLYADSDWKSKFITDYFINGIPRFILLDEQGNIVSPDAPRPSSPKLRALLDELI